MKSSKICRPRPCFCREALFRPLSSSAAVADHCRRFETSRKERHPTNLTETEEKNIFKPYLFSSTEGRTTLIAFVEDPLLGFSADRDASKVFRVRSPSSIVETASWLCVELPLTLTSQKREAAPTLSYRPTCL